MDSLIAAAARSLAAGDALGALKHVALRDDAPALAMRGIAMAQLGELLDARALLRRAKRSFDSRETLARARCAVAEAEVALALRELSGPPQALLEAANELDKRGDPANATHARLIVVRRMLLLGRLEEAAASLSAIDVHRLASPALVAIAELAAAEIGLRTIRTARAREALARALAAAERSLVPALIAEVADARALLTHPAARRWRSQDEEASFIHLAEVEALLNSETLAVDACRRGLRLAGKSFSLARRPVLFALVRALAEGWPEQVDRETLIERAFRIRHPDETHRARLRVEIGRLRALAAPLARIEATANGYRLVPNGQHDVALLLPPIEGDVAAMQALLADGAAWSTSALALALGESQRNVQRSLAELQTTGLVRSIGRGRSQRWLAPPLAGITTILLLPTARSFA